MRWAAFLLITLLATGVSAEPAHPFPELEKAVAQFDGKNLPPHPRLVLTPAEMKRVTAAARSDWGKEHWAVIRQYVDDGRKLEPPSEPAGYPHGKWNITDWRRIVAVGDEYQTRILAAAFAAVVTNDDADIREAKRWTLAAARLDPLKMTGMKNGVDHPAHDIPHAMALSYDWLYDKYSADERKVIRDSLTARARGLYEYLSPFRGSSWNNHSWFQTAGLVDAALAIADEVPEADAWWRYGSQLYFTEFLPKGGRDGDWHEGTHYVSYTLMFVYQWADALKTATGIDAYQIPWLQKVGRFCLMISPPRAGGIQFNDNNYGPPGLLDKVNAYVCARVTGDPTLQWYGDQIPVYAGALDVRQRVALLIAHDAALPAQPPGDDLPLGVWYRDAGWAVLRTDLASSDDVEFALKGGRYYGSAKSRGHDHPDQNGFLLNYLGLPLTSGSGYYDWYGSPHHNGWTFTGKAQNTLLVDGQEELVGTDGQIVSFVSDRTGMDFVESEAAGTFPAGLLASWRRQVLFLRPDLFVIRDVVKPTKPATISWLLHAPSEFKLDGQKLTVANGPARLSGEMLLPTDLKLEQHKGYPADAQPERRNPGDYPDQFHLSMTTPSPVPEGRFVFIMKPGKDGLARPTLSRETSADGMESYGISDAGRRVAQAYFFDAPTLHEFNNVRIAARVWAQGNVGDDLSTLCTGATQFIAGNQLIWQSDHPADISGLRNDAGWRRLSIRLDARAQIKFASSEKQIVTLDGKAVPAPFDPAIRTASLTLDEGTHILQLRQGE